jgi:hypothetical protein
MPTSKTIKKLIKVPLSNNDILNIVGDCLILTYDQLTEYDNIDDILKINGICILLYQTRKGYGHWCAVIKRHNLIEFFDPIGIKPDDELLKVPRNMRQILGQSQPHLSYLLLSSPYDIEYNNYKFQKNKKDVNTCGRHCAMRCLFKEYDIDEYHEMIKNIKGLTPDELVTILSHNILLYK